MIAGRFELSFGSGSYFWRDAQLYFRDLVAV